MSNEDLAGKHLIFYDGICSLCNRSIIFVFKHDKQDHFRVIQLQSKRAESLLEKYESFNATDLKSVAYLKNIGLADEVLLTKSTAALAILADCDGYKKLAQILLICPKFIRDFVYDLIAISRYQFFGKFDKCPVPDPKYRKKVIK